MLDGLSGEEEAVVEEEAHAALVGDEH
jgi:hypothetical protein